ncbi:hypothetical protein B0H14DRAFT_2900211 [Mycena olivaceomarginata]|nr:hypothetical protein B0H14DRAFT_2900211 [Mycena olivaceomarginata]
MHLPKSRLVLDLVDRAVESSNVTWISPQQQDIYRFGSTILAKWASRQLLDILCLQFCMASSSPSACGVCVRPDVTESAGEYQVIMPVPDLDGPFFLRMKDASGTETSSSVFTLIPAGPSVPASDSEPVAGSDPQAQAPLGPANSPVASPMYSGSPPAAALSATPSVSSQVSPTASTIPNVLSANTGPPPAAYAVPLSAVAALVLVAGVLFLKQRRKRGLQQHHSESGKSPSRTSSCKSNSSGRSEIGYALRVLSRHYGYASRPSPPLKTPRLRPPTLDAFPYPAYAQWGPPSASYGHTVSPPPHTPLPVEHLCADGRPRLPPIATTGSFMSRRSDPATHAVLADHLPSPPLSSSTSTPRCLLPAHVRSDTTHRNDHTDNPLGSPPADRERSERQLYARVASKLSVYRPNI